MDRREFLKNCSLVPFLTLPNTVPHWLLQGMKKPAEVFLFLHGLMFMEFDKAKQILTVTAPDIHDHDYCFLSLVPEDKLDKKLLRPMFRHLDWTKGELAPGDQDKFPDTIPQFSAGTTFVGRVTALGHRFQIVLPVPKEIIPLRISRPTVIELKGKVGTEIAKKPTFATVTCLRYNNSGGIHSKHHFYAEPKDCSGSLEHVNHAFQSSRQLFEMPEKFDLTVGECQGCCADLLGPKVKGLDIEDIYYLCEVLKEPIAACIAFTGGPLCSAIAVTP